MTLLLVGALAGLLALRRVSGGDVGFHLRAGNHILAGNGWPTTDPFTFTVSDHPYVDTSWGYQILLALIERMGGSAGMVLFHCGLVLTIAVLLYRTVWLNPAIPELVPALLLLGGVAAEMRYEVRPELVSYLFLAITLHLLHRHAEGRSAPLWLLPAIFLLWVNTHALFVLGGLALACFLVALAWIPLYRQRRFASLLLSLPFLYLAFRMTRNIPLVVVACLPPTVWGLSGGISRFRLAGRRGVRLTLVGATAVVAVVFGLRVQTDAYYLSSRRVERFGLSWNRLALPLDAAEYIARARLPGRMLNHLNFGGYLMWAAEEPVFVDGRLEVIGERFYVEYARMLSSEEDLAAGVARYGNGWIVVPYRLTPHLVARLQSDRRWRPVYVDHLAAIFARGALSAPSALQDGVGRSGPIPIDGLPGLGGPSRPGRLAHWLGGLVRRRTFPTEDFNRALYDYFGGNHRSASSGFARAIRASDGAYYEMYLNLGSALFRQGRLAQARDCYRVVLEERPDNRLAAERLIEIDRRSGS